MTVFYSVAIRDFAFYNEKNIIRAELIFPGSLSGILSVLCVIEIVVDLRRYTDLLMHW